LPRSARLERILSGAGRDFKEGLVPLVLFNDPEIYQAELDLVFGRSWTFVAHESEIPAPGDYLLRTIGEDPWIVVRDDSGRVNVLLDSCIHHGAQLCRGD
jgi:phenylpropionate dioxygenase-like ring-hydroxylating dioxygenase large terminal subunit